MAAQQHAARLTAAQVAIARRIGLASRRRRVPRSKYPKLIESDYATALVGIIDDAWKLMQPALADVPRLLEDAAKARGDAADPSRTSRLGLPIVIENPAGSIRRWVDSDGIDGETRMLFDYGYIDGFAGADGEAIDVYLGPIADPLRVFVVHQQSKVSGFTEYDEDKVMLGWATAQEARVAYLAQYDDPRFFGGVTAIAADDFKARLRAAEGSPPRAGAVRFDAGEGGKIRMLLDRVRDRLGVGSARRAEAAANRAAPQLSAFGKEQLNRQSRAALGIDLVLHDRRLPAMIEHFAAENAALIRSLAAKMLDDVEKRVTRAFTEGGRAEDVLADVQDRLGVSQRHARLIARDQIGKLNGQIARARHQEIGLTRFNWLTMNDEKVRPEHEVLGKGGPYPYDGEGAPPIMPGEEILCRCVEEPIFEDVLAQLGDGGDEEQAAPAPPDLASPPPARIPFIPSAPIPEPIAAATPPPPPTITATSTPAAIRALADRTIVSTKPLGGGANASHVATLDNGAKAVWKPVTGEDPDLRNNIEAGTYFVREAAASEVAEQLGVADLLPATVTTMHDGVDGSLQVFANGAKPLMSGQRVFDRAAAERMRVFDFVIGNTDRHRGNVMHETRDGRAMPVLIDHGLAFPAGPPQRFIQPWDAIPRDPGPLLESTRQQIEAIDLGKLAETLLSSGIDETSVTHTLYRAKLLKSRPEILAVPAAGRAPHGAYAWDEHAKTAHVKLSRDERAEVASTIARTKDRMK